jgi:hypothetical protein
MLETIAPGEVDLDGVALAVRYQADPQQPELLLVSLQAHRTEGDPARIRRSELRCVTTREPMTREAMHLRVHAEAKRRGIERVAWIEDG